jgi:hypothetical protein
MPFVMPGLPPTEDGIFDRNPSVLWMLEAGKIPDRSPEQTLILGSQE